MTRRVDTSTSSGSDGAAVLPAVTVIMSVVGLTFLFSFGNVLNLALRLGVPPSFGRALTFRRGRCPFRVT